MEKRIKRFLPAIIVVGCVCVALLVAGFVGVRDEGIPVLMYHHLVPDDVYEEMNFQENGAVVKLSDFSSQMNWLHDNGYNTIFISELVDLVKSEEELPPKTVVITFDDGYESNYVYAYPILRSLGMKANLAPVIKETQKREESGEPFDDKKQPHVTFKEMKAMEDSGVFEIGSHSYNGHGQINVDMKGKTDAFFVNRKVNTKSGHKETREEYLMRINRDIVTSKIILDEKLGNEQRYFVYPYGRCNKDLCMVVEKAGFSCAFTTQAGYVNKHSDLYRLPRLAVNKKVKNLDDFIDMVEGQG